MPPTLASLVQHSALKLTVRAGADRLGTPVRWAHASELADPVPYMEGGELLLVTATNLDARDPGTMRRYVQRLAGAGVVGIGFGVGVTYEEIPCGARRRRRGGRPPAPGSTPAHAVPGHQQGGVRGDRRGPVPVGHGRFRGPAGTHPCRGRRGRTRGPAHPPRRERRRLGRAVRLHAAPSSPPRPTGRHAAPHGSPPRWSGCGTAPPRPAWSSATARATTASSSSPWARAAATVVRWPSAPGRHSARPSATRCTPRSPC